MWLSTAQARAPLAPLTDLSPKPRSAGKQFLGLRLSQAGREKVCSPCYLSSLAVWHATSDALTVQVLPFHCCRLLFSPCLIALERYDKTQVKLAIAPVQYDHVAPVV